MKEKAQKFGVHTLAEIQSQAESWEGTIRRVEEKSRSLQDLYKGTTEVLFTGCGSAFNISHAVAPFFQRMTGKSCKAVHASDLMLNTDAFFNGEKDTLVIACSRSGDTTETAHALRMTRDAGARTIAIVCFGKSRMAADAHEALILEEAIEKSVTTTRSLTSMVLAGNYLAAICGNHSHELEQLRKLPAIARQKMTMFHEMGEKIASETQIRKYAFLGHGSYFGLAREAQLKVKEMVLLPSDSYVSLDFQHGPMSNVDQDMLVTILVSDTGRQYDLTLARNMKALGGKVLVLCDRNGGEFQKHADYLVELGSGLGDGIRNILYMPVLQFMAYYKSLAEDQDPDNPKNLMYYVDLEN